MRTSSKLLALALSAALQPAMAGTVKLDFEGITPFTQVGSYGGVEFTTNAWGVTANGEEAGIPACKSTYLFQPLDNGSLNCGALVLGEKANGTAGSGGFSFNITSELGFLNSIAFSFALREEAKARIDIYDFAGKALTGDTGVSLDGDFCHTGYFFCDWHTTSIKFDGLARTIVVSSVDQRLMLDDLALTTADAPSRLPEPGSIALAFGALGALGWTRKRAAR